MSSASFDVAEMRVSVPFGFIRSSLGLTTAALVLQRGKSMEGRETAKNHNLCGGVWAWERVEINFDQAVACISYRLSVTDFPASRRKYDWVFKLGPPLG